MKQINSITKSPTLRSEIASAEGELALIGTVPLNVISLLQDFKYEVLDLSQAEFGEEDEDYVVCLGYSHSGPVYGASGVRKVDVLKRLMEDLTTKTLVLPDNVALRHINAIIKRNNGKAHIFAVRVSDNCKLFSMVGDDVYNKKGTKLVFKAQPFPLEEEYADPLVKEDDALETNEFAIIVPEEVRYVFEDGTLRICEGTTDLQRLSIMDIKPSIEVLVIPSSVKEIPFRAFSQCSNLRRVSFGESVTTIADEAFCGCSNLSSIIIPDKVVRVGQYAFKDCAGIKSVHIGKSVSSVFQSFEGCQSIESFTVDPDNPNFDSRDNCNSLVYTKDERIVLMSRNSFIPSGIKNVNGVLYKGFQSLHIPDSVVSLEPGCFAGCSKLETLEIPKSVKNIGPQAFAGCSSLTSILIPNSMSMVGSYFFGTGLFSGCTHLEKVEVEPGCKNLDSREGCNGIIASHTNTFLSGCDKSFIPDSIKGIDNCAFAGCEGLKSIKIPPSVTTIGKWAFKDCKSLKTLSIPDSVTHIGEYAFAGCDRLETVILPPKVKAIPVDIFARCPSLSTIYVPKDRRKYYVSRFYTLEPSLFKSYVGPAPSLE